MTLRQKLEADCPVCGGRSFLPEYNEQGTEIGKEPCPECKRVEQIANDHLTTGLEKGKAIALKYSDAFYDEVEKEFDDLIAEAKGDKQS